MAITYEDADSAVFGFGTTLINLLKSSEAVELVSPAAVGEPGSGPRMQFTIPVDDVDAMCAELTHRGVQLRNGPMDPAVGNPDRQLS